MTQVTINYYTSGGLNSEFWDLYEERDGVWWRRVTDRLDDCLKYGEMSVADFVNKVTDIVSGLERATIELEHDLGQSDYSCEYYIEIRGWRRATDREVAEVQTILDRQAFAEKARRDDEIAQAKAILKREGLLP